MSKRSIYTHISWWIYRTLKRDQSFSTAGLLSTLSSLSFLIPQTGCIRRWGSWVMCAHFACSVTLCVHIRVTDCVCAYVHMAECAQQLSQLPALGAFHVHNHLFYSGIFKSEGLGMATAIVREQRKVLGCQEGVPCRSTAQSFSVSVAPHTSWKARGAGQASRAGRRS